MKTFKHWPLWLKTLSFFLIFVACVGALVAADYMRSQANPAGRTALATRFEHDPRLWLDHPVDVSAFEGAIMRGEVREVGVDGPRVMVTTTRGEHYSTRLLDTIGGLGARLETLSRERNFALTLIRVDERDMNSRLMDSLANVMQRVLAVASVAVTAFLAFYLIRQNGSIMGGKTQLAERPETGFHEVVGASEAKAALQQVTAFMKSPDKYLALGAKPPRGVLLEGPPGTGKTMLARALAGECGANFIAVDGSHFSSMFYGAGIAKVRELFATARKNAPCIVFIDEFDGIGQRSNGSDRPQGGGVSEENRIINKLLVEMDGFSAMDNVVVIGATNHAGNVDEALKRPGRFDLIARVSLPTLDDRRALFELCLGKVKAGDDIDAAALGRASSTLSHADITNVVNRATVLAAEQGATAVSHEHVLRSLESHQLGGEVSGMKGLMSPEDRHRIAVHETGHAIVAHVLAAGKVERVTIEPRGQALGVTFMTRANELPLYGEQELNARLGMLLAGREAELLVFGNTTSGASDDLKRASELAIDMVSSMGFSQSFGLLSMKGVPDKLVGPHIQDRVLDEARVMLERAQTACRQALESRRETLQALTDALLQDETVSGTRLTALLDQQAA